MRHDETYLSQSSKFIIVHLVGGLEHVLFFRILGMSSSELTNSIIFQKGGWLKTTSDPIVSGPAGVDSYTDRWISIGINDLPSCSNLREKPLGDDHQSINWGCIPTKRIVMMGLWDR